MVRRRIARLRTCDVEAGDPDVAVTHCKLGDLARTRRGAHCRQQRSDDDRSSRHLGAPHRLVEAREHRLEHFLERQAALGVQLGGKTHLGVDDTVLDQVLDALFGDSLERFGGLHHADGMGEALQVANKVAPGSSRYEPRRELLRIGRRQVAVTVLGSELHHCGRPQAAVEVVVEEHFRGTANLVEPGLGAQEITSSTTDVGAGGWSPMAIASVSASRAQSSRSDWSV